MSGGDQPSFITPARPQLLRHAACRAQSVRRHAGLKRYRLVRNRAGQVAKTADAQIRHRCGIAAQGCEAAHDGMIGPLPVAGQHFEAVSDDNKGRMCLLHRVPQPCAHLLRRHGANLRGSETAGTINDARHRQFDNADPIRSEIAQARGFLANYTGHSARDRQCWNILFPPRIPIHSLKGILSD